MEVCQLIPKHVLCNIHTVEDRKKLRFAKRKSCGKQIFSFLLPWITHLWILHIIYQKKEASQENTNTNTLFLSLVQYCHHNKQFTVYLRERQN